MGPTVIGTGHDDTVSAATLGVGSHTVRVEGNDGTDVTTPTVTVTVQSDPSNIPPSPRITFPNTAGQLVCCTDSTGIYAEVELAGSASDPEDGPLSGTSLV